MTRQHMAHLLEKGRTMKKTLIYGTATALVVLTAGAGVALTTCGRQEALYGPAPVQQPQNQEDEYALEALYGVPVDENEPIEDVYGPPPVFDDASEGEDVSVPAVYGPAPVG